MFGLSGFLRHGSSVARTIAFVIGGEFCFTKTGSGTTTMAALHTYTGPTVIKAGTLSVSVLADGGVASHVGASSSDASNLVLGGGVLDYTGSTVTIDRDVQLNTGQNAISVPAGVTLTMGGLMGTVGSFTKSGTGTLILNKARTGALSGNINVTGGTLIAGVADSLPSGRPYILSAGAALDLNGYDLTVARLEGAGNVYLGSATVDIQNGTTILSGVISGTGGVKKSGANVQILSGTNTYTGPTTVISGSLNVTGSIATSLQRNIRFVGAGTFSTTPLVLGASPVLTGTTFNIVTFALAAGATNKVVSSWTGTATGTPALEVDGVAATFGVPVVVGARTLTAVFTSTSGITITTT